MKDEPNSEAGLYPFEECCEHSFRVHSSKACQITGCDCKRRRQLPRPPAEFRAAVAEALSTAERAALPPVLLPVIEHLQEDGWKLSHEVVAGPQTTMVISRIVRPDGSVLDESAWTP